MSAVRPVMTGEIWLDPAVVHAAAGHQPRSRADLLRYASEVGWLEDL